ncbi:right-handed parallel beta-helix repeat-containing protein [Pseudonocardia nematodicida]|uniref:Right-handed parallel beta-helix repeat-containing protein n=1 Tax=Pseudonocardia nematodicida TaxID=1206997 RepID=A0ABV1K6S5_9PSEU
MTTPAPTERVDATVIDPGGSIQAAFDAGARTVQLRAGSYPGGVVLPSGARLVGAGAGRTELVPGRVAASDVPPLHDAPDAVDHGVVAHRVSDVAVEGLTIRGFSGAALYAHTVRGVHLRDVEAADNTVWGIYLRESTDLDVRDCRASGSRYAGIALAFCHGSDCEVADCETSGNAYGVFVDNSSRTRVRRVRAHGNAAGVLMLHQTYPGEPEGGVTDCAVADCELTGNGLSAGIDDEPETLGAAGPPMSGIGLAMIGVQRVTVTGNRITGNHPGGFSVMGAALVVGSSADWGGSDPADISVERNIIRDNSPADIDVDPDAAHLCDNTIGTSEGTS